MEDFDTWVSRGKSWGEAFLEMEKRAELYDPELMYYLEGALGAEARYKKEQLPVRGLRHGMILDQEVRAKNGVLLARKSMEVNRVVLSRLRGFAQKVGIQEPIRVLRPLEPTKGGLELAEDEE